MFVFVVVVVLEKNVPVLEFMYHETARISTELPVPIQAFVAVLCDVFPALINSLCYSHTILLAPNYEIPLKMCSTKGTFTTDPETYLLSEIWFALC